MTSFSFAQDNSEINWADSITSVIWNETVVNYDEAIFLSDSALSIYDKHDLNCKWISLAVSQNQFLRKSGKIDEAIIYCIECQNKFNSLCDSSNYMSILSSLASLHYDLGKFEKADSIANYALSIYNHEWGNAKSYGGILMNKGIANSAMGNMEKAKSDFRQCINYGKRENALKLQQDGFINIGSVMAMTEMDDSAYYFFNESLKIARARYEQQAMSQLYNNLAGLHDNPKVKLQYMDSAIATAKKLGDIDNLSLYTENTAYEYYEQMEFKTAFDFLEDHVLYKDSFLNIEKVKAIADVELKYETEKRKAEIQELQIQNLDADLKAQGAEKAKNRSLAGMGILALIIFGVVYRFVSVRKTKNLLQEKNALIEKEKERSDELLLNILPAEVAEELKTKGESKARYYKNVTVLFSDVEGFTRISELMSAQEIVAELDHCFKAFDKIIEKYKIEKIKTIGDSYMAVGGLHDPENCPPENVIHAAIEMRDFSIARRKERERLNKHAFSMRLGLHTGPVVAGIVGLNKFQYDIWGDTVNIANRMETSGERDKVNISEITYQLVKNDPQLKFNVRGPVQVKDKGAMTMYFVEHNNSNSNLIELNPKIKQS